MLTLTRTSPLNKHYFILL